MKMNKQISEYFAGIGSKGGKAGTGSAKARSSEQARAAVMSRWAKVKARKSKP